VLSVLLLLAIVLSVLLLLAIVLSVLLLLAIVLSVLLLLAIVFSVLLLLAIVFSVLLRFTDFDYPFGIFKLFFFQRFAKQTDYNRITKWIPDSDALKVLYTYFNQKCSI
jgi:hypothetical protein